MGDGFVYEFVRGDDFVIPMTLTDPDNNEGVSEDTYTGAYAFNDTGLTNAVYLGEYNNGVELTGDTTHVSLEFL